VGGVDGPAAGRVAPHAAAAAAAAAAADAACSRQPGGRGHRASRGAAAAPEERWPLQEGELNDADIEGWLDSLFTAAQ
jgi:hypothetical protein